MGPSAKAVLGFICRPYLSRSDCQAYGMVVVNIVCLSSSVSLSVVVCNKSIVAKRYVVGKNFLQI